MDLHCVREVCKAPLIASAREKGRDSMLKRSKDRKVANSLTAKRNTRIANSFGLPAGTAYSCPMATSVCEKVCYAGKLEKIYKGTRNNLIHNFETLKAADFEGKVALLNGMLDEFEAECDKWKAEKLFRIHWDGDFYDTDYTSAWREAIEAHPNTRFWVYTRVPSAAMYLYQLPNLALYFSADKDNLTVARSLESQGVKLALLGDTFEDAGAMTDARAAMCPEQRGQLELNGACVACGICIKGNVNIRFSISKK